MLGVTKNVSAAASLGPAARTADATGTGVDLAGFERALILIASGTITDGTHTVEIQESDDNTTFTAVADADLDGTEAAINDDEIVELGYLGNKRYIRVFVDVAGATTGGVYSATVVRMGPARKLPK